MEYSYEENNQRALEGMVGQTIRGISNYRDEKVRIELSSSDATVVFFHIQDCCESVWLEDHEWPEDIEGAVVHSAREERSEHKESVEGSGTWTFYRINTSKGLIYMRWCGESNGFYSESVYVYWDETKEDE